jgi:hypothetical protein
MKVIEFIRQYGFDALEDRGIKVKKYEFADMHSLFVLDFLGLFLAPSLIFLIVSGE